jgi:hypothetical protein
MTLLAKKWLQTVQIFFQLKKNMNGFDQNMIK